MPETEKEIPPIVEIVIEDEKTRRRREQLEAESQNLWLTDLFIDRPGMVLLVGFFCLFVMAGIAGALDFFAMSPNANRDFLIWSNEVVVKWDMQNLGREYIEKYDGGSQKAIRTQTNDIWATIILFQNEQD
jgi:hypothetical protein